MAALGMSTLFEAKLAELDWLLNDPDVRMEPWRVWSLADEVAALGRDQPACSRSTLVRRVLWSSSSSDVGTS